MRGEHEALEKLFEEIKLLAGQLEALVDKDDEEVRDDMEVIVKNLVEGFEVLDDDDLQKFLGAGRHAPPDGLSPAVGSGPGVRMSMSSISVETSVSISISGIVA